MFWGGPRALQGLKFPSHLKNFFLRVPVMSQWVKSPTSIHENVGSLPGLAQWVKESGVAMSCHVVLRHSSNLALLWLWLRPVAAAPVQPLFRETPYATGIALKRKTIFFLYFRITITHRHYWKMHIHRRVPKELELEIKVKGCGVPWLLTGLRTWHCYCCDTGSIPGLGTSICHSCGH